MPQFDSFVLFGEMRSGSNHLEYILNRFPEIGCHGEQFNPELTGMGNAHREEFMGYTPKTRDSDPLGLLQKIKNMKGVNGFRYFHEHDPRIFEPIMQDPRCAKVILGRNPIERYISYKIALETDLWIMTNPADHVAGRPNFELQEFEELMSRWQNFQLKIQRSLQVTGQTAFYIDYEDLSDLEVINGLGAFLGSTHKLDEIPKKFVPQNPEPISEKVANFPEMELALARLDRFNLSRTPSFEPRRGPAVGGYIAAKQAGLLYLPIRPVTDESIANWLTQFGGIEKDLTQKSLREWRKEHRLHRSFTLLRHPLRRAHMAFQRVLAAKGQAKLRTALRETYSLPLPPDGETMSPQQYHAALLGFLGFLRANLNAQTPFPVEPAWGSQTAALQGFAQLSPPDFVIREEELPETLDLLTRRLGLSAQPYSPLQDSELYSLSEILDKKLQNAAREAYARDYVSFGFGELRL